LIDFKIVTLHSGSSIVSGYPQWQGIQVFELLEPLENAAMM
jgi:hypothetical protein